MRELRKADIYEALEIIRLQYTNAYPIDEPRKEKILIDLWYNIFYEYSYEVFIQAVRESIRTSEFAPKPATIIKEIEKMQAATDKSDYELWAELKDVLYEVKDCTYSFFCTYKDEDGLTQADRANMRIDEIYAGLDPIIKDYLRNRENLIALSRADSTELSIEKGRFLKALPQIRERNKTLNSMPQEMRLFFSELTQQVKSNNEVPKLIDKK